MRERFLSSTETFARPPGVCQDVSPGEAPGQCSGGLHGKQQNFAISKWANISSFTPGGGHRKNFLAENDSPFTSPAVSADIWMPACVISFQLPPKNKLLQAFWNITFGMWTA